jgi:nucleoside-diphosphate-sugar epimerase
MKSVLVTGAAGFIGSQLCEALLAQGHAVRGIDAFTDHYARELKELNLSGLRDEPGFEFHDVDIADADLVPLTDGADWVFHLAARPGVRDSWTDFDDYARSNIIGTKRLLDACAERVGRVVYASSSSVYGNAKVLPVTEDTPLRPISPYGATKVMTETMAGAYAESRGLEVVGMRYFTVYGPRQRPDMGIARFIEAAVGGREIGIYGDGGQMRDFTFVGDVVAATIAAAEQGAASASYNVASGNPLPLLEVLDVLGEVLEQPLRLAFEEPKTGDVRDTAADTQLAAAQLGFQAAMPLRDGLAQQVEVAALRRELAGGRAGA